MVEPRVIINLQCLLDTFSDLPDIFINEIITIFSKEYDDSMAHMANRQAGILLDRKYSLKARKEAASVYTDLINATNKMSKIERDNLRKQCLDWLKKNQMETK